MQVTTKKNFGPFWGCFFAISEKKSRNLGILCARFEELPNLGGVCFMTFIHISNCWAIITILGHFAGVFLQFLKKNSCNLGVRMPHRLALRSPSNLLLILDRYLQPFGHNHHFGPFRGCFLQFLKKKSRNLGVKMSHRLALGYPSNLLLILDRYLQPFSRARQMS